MAANANTFTKNTPRISVTTGSFTIVRTECSGSQRSDRVSCVSDSFSAIAVQTALTIASPAATNAGSPRPNPSRIPPSAGPTTNPSPMAAPSMPIAFARYSGVVTSAAYACATGTVDAMIPEKMRAANKTNRLSASPKITRPIAAPVSPMISTGLRPIRSDTLPQIGEKMNCMIEYEANRSPITDAVAPYVSA